MYVIRDLCAYMKLFQNLWRKRICTSISLFYQRLPISGNLYKLRNRWYDTCMTRFKALWINWYQSLSNQKWYSSWNKRGRPSQNWRFHLKSDPHLTVGILTKALLAKLLDDGGILENSSDCFYHGVRAFSVTAYEIM